jgi:hypothetical protein
MSLSSAEGQGRRHKTCTRQFFTKNRDPIDLKINVTTGDKTFNWLFDTGAAVTCMNANSFKEAFSGKRPKLPSVSRCFLHTDAVLGCRNKTTNSHRL